MCWTVLPATVADQMPSGQGRSFAGYGVPQMPAKVGDDCEVPAWHRIACMGAYWLPFHEKGGLSAMLCEVPSTATPTQPSLVKI